jgi:radical SAM superfamily enzyme YgiQ (UPF0313 family)
MIDCLIIGQNDPDFANHIKTIRFTFGAQSAAYQDQDLTFITYKGKPYRPLDLINLINQDQLEKPLSNLDFLWPTIAVLGSFLVKHGMSFDYVNQFRYEKDLLRSKLLTQQYRVIAISTTLYVTDTPIREIVGFIRKYSPDALIIVGGPYIKNRLVDGAPAQIDREFEAIGADLYVNNSEGQMTLVRTIECLRDGRSLEQIENLVWSRRLRKQTPTPDADRPHRSPIEVDVIEETRAHVNEQRYFTFNPHKVEDNPLEENPIDLALFRSDDLNRFFSLSTAKSCPYACLFCGFPSRAGEYRFIDVARVENYLDRLRDIGVDTLTFLDDTFNVPKTRFKEILRMMIRNGYNFRWNSFYRSDQGDQETIELMAASGCEGVFLGIESASDQMLQKMNKTSRRKHYAAAIPLLRKNGIYTHANFIVGFPGETAETVQETLAFVKEYRPDTYKAQLWYADNTSPVWKKKDELKIQGMGFSWSHETMDSTEAARWVDYIYEQVTDSAFLPQEGFGMWSIFYLQRQGMSRRQVLSFLQGFSEAVLVKRRDPKQQEMPSQHVAKLFALGRIDAPRQNPESNIRVPTELSVHGHQ